MGCIDQSSHGPRFKSAIDVMVAVELIPGQGNEQLPFLDRA
jgi:hypothetical protein